MLIDFGRIFVFMIVAILFVIVAILAAIDNTILQGLPKES